MRLHFVEILVDDDLGPVGPLQQLLLRELVRLAGRLELGPGLLETLGTLYSLVLLDGVPVLETSGVGRIRALDGQQECLDRLDLFLEAQGEVLEEALPLLGRRVSALNKASDVLAASLLQHALAVFTTKHPTRHVDQGRRLEARVAGSARRTLVRHDGYLVPAITLEKLCDRVKLELEDVDHAGVVDGPKHVGFRSFADLDLRIVGFLSVSRPLNRVLDALGHEQMLLLEVPERLPDEL